MSQDGTNSNQEHEKIEENEEENSELLNSEVGDNTNFDEGYQTPTSEEHKIPAVVLSRPPPAPRKRKRLILMTPANLQKRLDQGVDETTIVMNEADLNFLLKSFAGESRVSPGSRPTAGSKKGCVRD